MRRISEKRAYTIANETRKALARAKKSSALCDKKASEARQKVDDLQARFYEFQWAYYGDPRPTT